MFLMKGVPKWQTSSRIRHVAVWGRTTWFTTKIRVLLLEKSLDLHLVCAALQLLQLRLQMEFRKSLDLHLVCAALQLLQLRLQMEFRKSQAPSVALQLLQLRLQMGFRRISEQKKTQVPVGNLPVHSGGSVNPRRFLFTKRKMGTQHRSTFVSRVPTATFPLTRGGRLSATISCGPVVRLT